MSIDDEYFEDIQGQDDRDAADAFRRRVENDAERKLQQSGREIEATVRVKIRRVREARSDDDLVSVESDLRDLHYLLWHDERRGEVLQPDSELDPKYQIAFRECHQMREAGERPDPAFESETLVQVAHAQGHTPGGNDLTLRAPVRMEAIDEPGARTVTDRPTPIGRRRLKAASAADIEQRMVEIPHEDCEHILAVALPRQGKDSTIVSIGKNLMTEHGYSYFSILDDGRNETPMLAIPSDDDGINRNLERFSQAPEALSTEVYVPAMGDLPDHLPANHVPFTIGIDKLTPSLILRLAGITKGGDATTESRINKALTETLEQSQEVTQLVGKLEMYAEETEATIEWTEWHETGSGSETKVKRLSYQMEADDALRKAAQRLSQLAAEGLVTSPSAATNVNMKDLVADNETATVLSCNFLPEGQEAMKYTIMDLWLRMIDRVRNHHPRLPRVAVEIRELKTVAPSKWGDVKYRDATRPLKQTIFYLSSQGSSRRILMLGSTQKLNDVDRSIRQNMHNTILLKLGPEEIDTLDKVIGFSDEEKKQLREFSTGQGMIVSGGKYYPILFRGAPCGLGQGDRHWRDRYGLAWGARVREESRDGWTGDESDPDWWVDLATRRVHTAAEGKPPLGTWFLLPEDLTEHYDDLDDPPDEFGQDTLDAATADRREFEIPSRLALEPTGFENRQRTVHLDPNGYEATKQDLMERHDVPEAAGPWLDRNRDTRHRLVESLRIIDEGDYGGQEAIAEQASFSRSALANYLGETNGLRKMVDKSGSTYSLTPVGKATLDAGWEAVDEALDQQ